MTLVASSVPRTMQTLSPAQAWLDVVPAGACLGFTAGGPGAGAALFAWSQADPYEQLSDAYTFMELRRIQPGVGDDLYSTLRRPMFLVARDDPGRSVDLLRHDCWLARSRCLDELVEQARAKSVRAPLRPDWPYAVNVFARTRVAGDGELLDEPVDAEAGQRVELVARFDMIVAVMAAATTASVEVSLDGPRIG